MKYTVIFPPFFPSIFKLALPFSPFQFSSQPFSYFSARNDIAPLAKRNCSQ